MKRGIIMKKFSEMTGHEKIAYRNVKGVFQWEVGGWYNCIQDGCEEYIPEAIEQAKDIIYCESMVDSARPGMYRCGGAPYEMRFAGEAFIRSAIDYFFAHDEDVKEISEVKGWK